MRLIADLIIIRTFQEAQEEHFSVKSHTLGAFKYSERFRQYIVYDFKIMTDTLRFLCKEVLSSLLIYAQFLFIVNCDNFLFKINRNYFYPTMLTKS